MPASTSIPGPRSIVVLLGLAFALLAPSPSSAKAPPAPPAQEPPDPAVVREIALPAAPRTPGTRVRGLHRVPPPVEEIYVFVDSLDGRPLDDDAGWEHFDRSEQPTAWHIDSLLTCQGKAWWCGIVDSSWIYDSNRAGYDNNWVYGLANYVDISGAPLNQTMRLSFRHRFSAELDYDFGILEVLDPTDDWLLLAGFTGEVGQGGGCDTFTVVIPDSIRQELLQDPLNPLPLVFRFEFRSDLAYSSADGLYNGDGWMIDNVTLRYGNNNVIFHDNCENGMGTWDRTIYPAVGDYWRMANNVLTEDLCTDNRSNIWVDFDAASYSLVPRLDNWLVTPAAGIQQADEVFATFDVYRNLPLNSCYYYFIRYRTKDVGDPDWSEWADPTRLLYYGALKDWARQRVPMTGAGGHDSIQVALALKDFGPIYCGGSSSGGNIAAHFDNVAIGIVASAPPKITTRDVDLFQDTFETAPFMYRDDNFNSPLGDSAVVQVDATRGYKNGYMYYRTSPGSSFSAVPLQVSAPALPSSRYGDVPAGSYPAGSILEYYFAVTDSQDVTVYYPWDAPNSQEYFSASVLPIKSATNPVLGCVDSLAHILFVNNFAGREEETTIATALNAWGYKFDTWEVNGPSSGIGNTPGGSQANGVPQYYWPQTDLNSLLQYSTIIWHAGDLTSFSLSQQDQQLLQSWIQQSGRSRNLWIEGDNIAYQLAYFGGEYNSFLGFTCGVRFIRNTWETFPQDSLHPLVTGPAGSPTAGRSFRVSADCPGIDAFDLIQSSSSAPLNGKAGTLLYYPNSLPAATRYATKYNPFGPDSARVVYMGFNYNKIEVGGERLQLAKALMQNYFQESACYYATGVEEGPPVGEAPAVRDALLQNAPNPFNPDTRIGYSVSQAGRVEIRIYGVGGRLVKRFVERVRAPGRYSVRWDGRDEEGRGLSSGVYFYEIETEGGFRASRKLLMLK